MPAWAFPGWRGAIFPSAGDPLTHYSAVFNAVEGNTTFYGVPSESRVQSWKEAVAGRDFRFCFKLPQTVTHRRSANRRDLHELLNRLTPLEAHLGPLLVQFPPTVGLRELDSVAALLQRLPTEWPRVLELRHPELHEQPELWQRFRAAQRPNLVVMDANPLHAGDPTHPAVVAALHDKQPFPNRTWSDAEPKPSIRFLRLVLHPDATTTSDALKHWAQRISDSFVSGSDHYVMIHCPDNQYCPAFASQFHEQLARLAPVGDSIVWPASTAQGPEQGDLF